MSDSMYVIAKDLKKQLDTDSLEYLEFYDKNLNNADANTDYTIEIKDLKNFYLPHKSYLKVDFQLIDTNDALFANGANVALQNNAVGLFKRWIFEMNGQQIETVDDAHLCNTIQSLVYFSDEYSSTIASSQLWYPDTVSGGLINPVAFDSITSLETVNYGQRKRQQLLNASKVFSVFIPLKNVMGWFKSFKSVCKDITLGLRLERNLTSNLILRGNGVNDGKVVFKSIKWYCPRVKPNAIVLGSLAEQLSSGQKMYVPFVDSQLYRSNLIDVIPNNYLFQIKTKRKNPLRIFVAFQTQARATGDQQQCKRVFDNVGLTRLRANLNGTQQFPERELETTFTATQQDYARAYHMFLECGMKDHGIDKGSIVKFDTYSSLYPIFCIDMSNKFQLSEGPNSSLIDLYISATTQNFYCYVVVESEREWRFVGTDGGMKNLGTDIKQ